MTLKTAMMRGAGLRCPACGEGKLFARYLQVAQDCPSCGEALHHHRADDLPAYILIVVMGHILVSCAAFVEMHYHPAYWIHAALWIPLCFALALSLLPPIKGGIVGIQWFMGMHGFAEAKRAREGG
jgi:uncharacterized protein (DUF983 family)